MTGVQTCAVPISEWLAPTLSIRDFGNDIEYVRGDIHEAELARLREERDALRVAIEYAAHQMEKGRIWGGMEWHYNPLHPHLYRAALERLQATLKEKQE